MASITPLPATEGVRIDGALLIKFNESIDVSTIKKNFRVRRADNNEFIKGNATILHDDSLRIRLSSSARNQAESFSLGTYVNNMVKFFENAF